MARLQTLLTECRCAATSSCTTRATASAAAATRRQRLRIVPRPSAHVPAAAAEHVEGCRVMMQAARMVSKEREREREGGSAGREAEQVCVAPAKILSLAAARRCLGFDDRGRDDRAATPASTRRVKWSGGEGGRAGPGLSLAPRRSPPSLAPCRSRDAAAARQLFSAARAPQLRALHHAQRTPILTQIPPSLSQATRPSQTPGPQHPPPLDERERERGARERTGV
jgi:hypothetical protein